MGEEGQEMSLVIAGGKSVTDFDGEQLARLAYNSFTFGVNDSGLLWPCDVIVALDPDWIRDRQVEIKHINKPVITRKWDMLKDLGLDLIELDNKIPYKLSGMVACKISDSLASHSSTKIFTCICGENFEDKHATGIGGLAPAECPKCGSENIISFKHSGSKSYVFGMDHTAGHYYNDLSDCSKVVELDVYAKMGLTNTVNMGVHSKISCWPKQSKLPNIRRIASTKAYKAVALAWVRGEVEKGTFNK